MTLSQAVCRIPLLPILLLACTQWAAADDVTADQLASDGDVQRMLAPMTVSFHPPREPWTDRTDPCPSQPAAYRRLFMGGNALPLNGGVALRLTGLDSQANDWRLVVRTPDDDCVLSVVSREVLAFTGTEPEVEYWTAEFDARVFYVEVHSDSRVGQHPFSIDAYLLRRLTPGSKAYVDPANPKIAEPTTLRDLPIVMDVAQAVGKLEFFFGDKRRPCSGFLISASGHFLTNHHCFCVYENCGQDDKRFRKSLCKRSVVTFRDPLSGSAGDARRYACDELLVLNYQLDFALIKLRGTDLQQNIYLKFAHRLTPKAPAFVVQFPVDPPRYVGAQGIAYDGCTIMEIGLLGRPTSPGAAESTALTTEFSHTCDTAGGSSGSPVALLTGEVVGLHRMGRQTAVPPRNVGVAVTSLTRALSQYVPGMPVP